MKTKPLYKVTLNWYGETFLYWRHANSKTGAFLYALRAHAEKVERSLYSVKGYFDGGKDNYLITMERSVMPLLCVKCNTRVHGSLTKETYYCPNCDKELERKDTYKVGKRFFQSEEKVVKLEKIRQKRKKLSGLRKKIWKRS